MPDGSREGPLNQFSRRARLDEGALIRLVFAFCIGTPIERAAAKVGVSAKTTRAVFIRLRARLAQPTFNRWHAAYQMLPNAPSADAQYLAREAFLHTLSACYGNETCARNFALGNRKTRLCRACPMPARFTVPEYLEEALDLIDRVRGFYARLGIRGEKGPDPVTLFRLRLIHTVTIATALGESLSSAGALVKPEKPSFLSVWTLLDLLLTDLAARPL